MIPSRTARVIAAFTTVALAASVGCGVFESGTAVVLIGDSLTVLTTDEVAAGAKPEFHIETNAEWGVRIDEELDPASEIAADDPDQVIINLGTNNVLQHYDTVSSGEDLSTLIDQFADARCVHLVTINEQIRHNGEDFSAVAAALNEEIRRIAARQLNTDVIDWNKIVVDNAANGIIDDDTVHPNPAGVALLADAYVQAIKSC